MQSIRNVLAPLMISAPFGIYIQMQGVTSVFGTYTLLPRKGLFTQLLKTLRPLGGGSWRNQLGLRNQGIACAANPGSQRHLLSITAIHATDWKRLCEMLLALCEAGYEFGGVELNLSCPNAETLSIQESELRRFADHFPLIAKLSPRRSVLSVAEKLHDWGVNAFHLTNTLKTTKGGISGPLLRAHALSQVERFRARFTDEVHLVGGGGIRSEDDLLLFKDAGANSVAVASLCFEPWRLLEVRRAALRLFPKH